MSILAVVGLSNFTPIIELVFEIAVFTTRMTTIVIIKARTFFILVDLFTRFLLWLIVSALLINPHEMRKCILNSVVHDLKTNKFERGFL